MIDFNTFRRVIDLSDFAPPISRDAQGVQEVYRIESLEVQALWDILVEIFQEQFIRGATSFGLEAWEEIFNIPVPEDSTAEERRTMILIALAGQRPFTMIKLRELLDGICGVGGYKIIEDFTNYTVHFRVALGVKRQRDAMSQLLKEILPMNLIYDIDLLYNRHIDLHRFTHKELAQFKHFQLNQEVLL